MRLTTGKAGLVAIVVGVGLLVGVPSSAGAPVVGAKPWVIVLCKFRDEGGEPATREYYEDMFRALHDPSDPAKRVGVADYWDDVSYGKLDVTETTVVGWNTVPMNRYVFGGLNRKNQVQACAETAVGSVDFADYFGVIAINNFTQDSPPAPMVTTLAAGMDKTQTTMTVSSSAGFPDPPFPVYIERGTAVGEAVNVTAVSGNTWTVTRAYQRSAAGAPFAHAAGADVRMAPDTDSGAVGGQIKLGDVTYTSLAQVGGAWDYNHTSAVHEMGHGFGYGHSRSLSASTQDYTDVWDMMSAQNVYSFQGTYGGPNGSTAAATGPGLTAINLDLFGWLDPARLHVMDTATNCSQTTLTMPALNHPEVAGPFAVRFPGSVSIPNKVNEDGTQESTTADSFWLEYRQKDGWDRGIPASGLVVHLRGGDTRPYWVDHAGTDGLLEQGETYVAAGNNVYVAVHSVDMGTSTARVSLSGCPILIAVDYVGPTEGDYTDRVVLEARVTVLGSGTPVEGVTVDMGIGSQDCAPVTTSETGLARCDFLLEQDPGTYFVDVVAGGAEAFAGSGLSREFVIDKEDTRLINVGAVTGDYHDTVRVGAQLLQGTAGGTPVRPGRSVTFKLGAEECSATIDSSFGRAYCDLTPNQIPGDATLEVEFAGDAYFKPSTLDVDFEVTKEETTAIYTGPWVIEAGSVSLRGRLLEDDGSPVDDGTTLELSVGAQSCAGTTSGGEATCAVTLDDLGEHAPDAEFSGNAYYEESSWNGDGFVVAFAYPSGGVFAVGDLTAAAAISAPGTTVTWWSDEWSILNQLTAGPAPESFKGFVSSFQKCGGTWSAAAGRPRRMPVDVPSYMGTLVMHEATQAGRTISGLVGAIVVVRTDDGYQPNPGHAGTGTIVATYCTA